MCLWYAICLLIFLSKEINVADFDLIYAGAQKNMGPAGTTVYIVKEEILGKVKSFNSYHVRFKSTPR
jgi:phosphoserine aminotransferase